MSEVFNQTLFFENIYFLIKKAGKKIGEIETEAGVSPGYISRTSKEGGGRPGIDFIMSVAKILNVSVDALLKIDFSKLTPTEKYLLNFFEKLSADTIDGKLEWNKESEYELNNLETDINGNVDHPLFHLERFFEDGENDYPDAIERVVFKSSTFGIHTAIVGDCFSLRLKNGVTVYIMNIGKSVYRSGDKNVTAKEVWLYSPLTGKEFLCANPGSSNLGDLPDSLYMDVLEDSRHPKINKYSRKSIDAFMRNDLEDDKISVDEVPF